MRPRQCRTRDLAESVPIDAEDIQALADFARNQDIDLTVVGPEGPLVKGITDLFEEQGLSVFGPSKAAAQLEGSKVFSKNLMDKYNIPCARGKAFTDSSKAKAYARFLGAPCVVKADGLAAGKGVILCATLEEANQAIDSMIMENSSVTPAPLWWWKSALRERKLHSLPLPTAKQCCCCLNPRTTNGPWTMMKAEHRRYGGLFTGPGT